MIDFKIDFSTNNLVIENGDFVLVRDLDEILQSLHIRLNMLIGNWFLDNRIGVDYFGKILKKGATKQEIERELKRVIRETVGVTGILSFTLKTDTAIRKLSVSFVVSTIYGNSETINNELGLS